MTNTSNKNEKKLSYFSFASVDHAIAGLCAGFTTTALLHPLDLIKTRFQVQDVDKLGTLAHGRYRNTFHAFQTIIRNEGFAGLYQGCTPNLIGSVTAWGSYFFAYDYLKGAIGNNFQIHGSPQHMLAAGSAGVVVLTVTNPIWVVKTRMCTQVAGSESAYSNFPNAIKSIFRTEGLAGLYKGFAPGLFGVNHGIVQFAVYEKMKKYFANDDKVVKHNFSQYMFMAAFSKIVATTVTYPYQVIRSRIQIQRSGEERYGSALDCIKKIWKTEGVRGFYRGLGSNVLRVTPAACVTFVVYENVSNFFKTQAHIREEAKNLRKI